MRLKLSSVLLSSLSLLGGACIVEAPGGASPEERRAATVTQVPPLSLRNGANLGGKVELVGATVQPGRIAPGDQAKVTLYFKVLQPIEDDYLVFVHVEDPEGRMERMNVDHKPAGGMYATSQWKPGETVKDEFNIALPSGASPRSLNIWLGLWEPRSDTRLKLTNPDAVRNDGRDRILLGQVPVAR
ncbi:hypothetical protein [Pyxidicoccus xibeiensis]|uniref:hypothetical protein n=1 Tax=Pyxidicoccus xibeiensis TaxID=2906759 RepID=UPI0020A794B9|nr:hypothetical protein [Pyxidicoccus xibeiensis]MCP3144043.1 hypothetical protein [Pyxidicoccus xibeiensis]